jgi:hypothetical protein
LSPPSVVTNSGPSITAVTSSPQSPISGTSTVLTATATDDGGAGNLSYAWSVLSKPAGASDPTFSGNGTNGDSSTTATFTADGNYTFQVNVTDSRSVSTTSTLSLTVSQTLDSIAVTPNPGPNIAPGATQQFSALGLDQFGSALATQPSFIWSATGAGSVSANGLFTASINTGPYTVSASASGITGSISGNVTGNWIAPISAQQASAGDLVAVSTRFIDSQPNVTHTATIDWGDGTTEPADVMDHPWSSGVFASHEYVTSGQYSMAITIHGGALDGTVIPAAATVLNSAPSASAGATVTVDEGELASFTLDFTDSDSSDTHTATINWGDGTNAPALVGDTDGGGSVFASHTYVDNGTFQAVATITDASGATTTASRTFVVQNVAPQVDIGSAVMRVDIGVTSTLSALVTDPGINDTFTYSWVLTDVNNQVISTATNQDLSFLPVSPARFTATCTVTDSDGATGVGRTVVIAVDPSATPDDSIPEAPTDLSVGTYSPDGVTLNWTDNSDDEDGFTVEWSDDGENYYAIDVLGPDETTYTDPYPIANQQNSYRVSAYRDLIDSAVTSVVAVTPFTAPVAFDNKNGGFNGRNTLSPYAVVHDHELSVGGTDNPVTNDLHWADGTFTVIDHTNPSHGTVDVQPDGSFTYTPNAGYVGSDTFAYTVADNAGNSANTPIAIDVTNAVPVSKIDAAELDIYEPVEFDGETYQPAVASQVSATDADGDSFTYEVVTAPKHGQLIKFDPDTGDFVYLADSTFNGADAFTFVAKDGLKEFPADPDDNDPLPACFSIVSHNVMALSTTVMEADHESINYIPYALNDGIKPSTPPQHGGIVGDENYVPVEGYYGQDRYNYDWLQPSIIPRHGSTNLLMVVPQGSTARGVIWGSQSYFQVSNSDTTAFSSTQTGWNGVATLTLNQLPKHGTLDFSHANDLGAFPYTPKRDPQTGEPYYGWDFFSVTVTAPWGATATQWLQLDVGNYQPPPQGPLPPDNWEPDKFDGSSDQLWSMYNRARDQLKKVLLAEADQGQVAKLLDDQRAAGQDPSDVLMAEGVDRLRKLESAFRQYSHLAAQAQKYLGTYLAKTFLPGPETVRLSQAIEALPLDVAGIKPTDDQLKDWSDAIANTSRGAGILVDRAGTVVTIAERTKQALDAIQLALGAGFILKKGIELATKEGCKALVKYTVQQIVNIGKGLVVNAAANQGMALAVELGIIDPQQQEMIRAGAAAVQVFCLMRASLAAQAAQGAGCFAAGTVVHTANGEVPIEQIKLGHRVLTASAASGSIGGPPSTLGDSNATAVDRSTWKQVDLRTPDGEHPGQYYMMQLLESPEWLANNDVHVGGSTFIALPELGISGLCDVLAVGPCPEIEPGDGRVVLGTFQHVSDDLVDVEIAGQSAPLRVTTGHKLWSLDRGGWIEAGALQKGERLSTNSGVVEVENVLPEHVATAVYNLDVEGDHRYLVGDLGVLAHNVNACDFQNQNPQRGTIATGQRLGYEGNNPSRVLRQNMRRAGVKVPPDSAAHHIVAESAEAAGPAQDVLRRNNIDLNQADNGVFLPRDSRFSVKPIPTHSQIHTSEYYDAVNQRLTAAEGGGRNAVLDELAAIRSEILAGTFPSP